VAGVAADGKVDAGAGAAAGGALSHGLGTGRAFFTLLSRRACSVNHWREGTIRHTGF